MLRLLRLRHGGPVGQGHHWDGLAKHPVPLDLKLRWWGDRWGVELRKSRSRTFLLSPARWQLLGKEQAPLQVQNMQ